MSETTIARGTPAASKRMNRPRRRALSTASKSEAGIVALPSFSTSEWLWFCEKGSAENLKVRRELTSDVECMVKVRTSGC